MFKDNLAMLRRANNLSQEEVAEKVNVSRQAYAKWERGESVPDIEKCADLARLYNTTLDDEFDENFDDDNGDCEDDEACGIDGPSIMIDGLPEDIDREAVEAVIEITCNILDTLIEKAAASRKGESDEGV